MEGKQILAIVVVALLAAGAIGFIVLSPEKDPGDFRITIVAQANSEGSGIFVRGDLDVTDFGGKIFLTPGTSSIQHMLLMDYVTEHGYKFAQARDGELATDTVYFVEAPPAQMSGPEWLQKEMYSGGIVWEPYVSEILNSGLNMKAHRWSKDLWEDHPCCVLAVDTEFAKNNGETVKRFVAAHKVATEWIIDTIAAGSGDDYEALLDMVTDFSFGERTSATVAIVEGAFAKVNYDYAMSEEWKGSLETVLETYDELALLNEDALDRWKLDSFADVVDKLVDSSYLDAADDVEIVAEGTALKSVRVGWLQGDIHQISQLVGQSKYVGDALGFGDRSIFEAYGLQIVRGAGVPYANGGAAMNAFFADSVDFAFLGSPPALLRSVNQI